MSLWDVAPSFIFIMKVIIFNDTQNFNGSLNIINERFNRNEKRFWDYKKYIPFLIKKIKSIDNLNDKEFQLIKTFFYEGKYNSNLMKNFRWGCHQEIRKINQRIEKERTLLNIISQEKSSHKLRRKVNKHVEDIKKGLIESKEKYFKYIQKQERNLKGQKNLFKELENNPLIEIKHTPLKQSNGEVYQKGVDVLLATDLIHLAHTDAYDIAIVLSGDTDLIEAIKLVKSLGKTVIIISYHNSEKPKLSNISDLMKEGKFINLKNLTKKEIFAMSKLRKKDT